MATVVGLDDEIAPTRRSRRAKDMREFAREVIRTKVFLVGSAVLIFWVVDAFTWRWIVPYDPQESDPNAVLQGPSMTHFFGTDDLGRDVFSRVLSGATTALTVAPAATALGLVGGVTLGLIAGYRGGLIDEVIMRLIDALLAFPAIIMAVLILAVLGRSTLNVVIVLGIIFIPLIARTVRSAVLVVRSQEYMAAARLRGESHRYAMSVEILPNIADVLVVEATVRLGYAIFTAATLSFLGLGIQPPAPDWGLSIALGRAYVQVAPWVVLFPAAALATLVVSVNLIVDGLKQVSAR